MFIFQTQGVTPRNYATNVSNIIYAPGAAHNPVTANLKIPNKWVIDGIEVFSSAYMTANAKRLPAEIDGGSVLLTNQLGHGCPVLWGQRPWRRMVAVWVRLAWVRVLVCAGVAVCWCV